MCFMGRLEDNLHKNVWSRANHYARLWDAKTALSAGIAALDMLTAEQREKAISKAKHQPDTEDVNTDLSYVLRVIDKHSSTIKTFTKAEQAGVKKLEAAMMVEQAKEIAAAKKRQKKSS